MSAQMVDRLVVVHHDDRITEYAGVRYYPWRDGVTVWDAEDGSLVADHADVLYTTTGGQPPPTTN